MALALICEFILPDSSPKSKLLCSPPSSFKAATHTLYVCFIINPVELHLYLVSKLCHKDLHD